MANLTPQLNGQVFLDKIKQYTCMAAMAPTYGFQPMILPPWGQLDPKHPSAQERCHMEAERKSQDLAIEFQDKLLLCMAMAVTWQKSHCLYQKPESYPVKDRLGQFCDQGCC